MTQLIETSLISAHFADSSRAIYLDVFSYAAGHLFSAFAVYIPKENMIHA